MSGTLYLDLGGVTKKWPAEKKSLLRQTGGVTFKWQARAKKVLSDSHLKDLTKQSKEPKRNVRKECIGSKQGKVSGVIVRILKRTDLEITPKRPPMMKSQRRRASP